MSIRLAFLGPVCVTGAEAPSSSRASQQRRIALLALIATAPNASITRDRLLGFLWPERDERTARHLLADSLYVLRQTLGRGAIVCSGDTMRLSPELVSIDVVDFRRALVESRWSDALDLYRGDFLDGFLVRNAAEFEQWASLERTRLRVLATRAASALATERERAGQLSGAVAAAERALELAPHDEAALRDLLKLLVAPRNTTRAGAVSRGFMERLAVDLGVAPSDETRRSIRQAQGVNAEESVFVVVPSRSNPPRTHHVDSVTANMIAQGRYHWHQRTRAAVGRAMQYFTRSVERDPKATTAWTGLADCWVIMSGRGYVPPAYAIERAEASARRALALDDGLSAVYTSIGGVYTQRRRWHDAECALRKAVALDPGNADAHHWLAITLFTGFGNHDEAIREQAIAASLNPLSPIMVGALGWHHYLRGEYQLSRSWIEPALDLNPEMEEGHTSLARVAARLGDDATVRATIEAGLARRNDLRGDLLAEQASAFGILGDVRRARQLALEASAYDARPLNLALAWATIGDGALALEQLAPESFDVYWAPQVLWWDQRLDSIRDDRRFVGIRQRAEGVWSPAWR